MNQSDWCSEESSFNGDSSRTSAAASHRPGSTVQENVPIQKAYEKHIRHFMDVIDTLRSLRLDDADFTLPKIATIGDQGVGKTSLLEALSGEQLPRGTGTVTKVPLEVILRKTTENDWSAKLRYRDKVKVLSNSGQVDSAIRAAQEEIVGMNCIVKDELVTLEVMSPNVPNLTLIDLPGICRMDKDIHEQTTDLIRKYIKPKNTLIIVVFPAASDIETVEALQLSKEVDPDKSRTIGVLTKLDLVGHGSEQSVMSLLNNEIAISGQKFYLQKGFVAIKCRSQDALNKRMSLPDAIQEEMNFFEKHSYFRQLDQSKVGIETLGSKLAKNLYSIISVNLPKLKEQVCNRQKMLNLYLEEMQPAPESYEESIQELVMLLNLFNNTVGHVFEGQYTNEEDEIRLYSHVREESSKYAVKIEEIMKEGKDEIKVDNEEIASALRQQRGFSLPDFIDDFPVCRRRIQKLLQKCVNPSNEYLDVAASLVGSVLQKISNKHFGKYPKLQNQVKILTDDLRKECLQQARADMKKLFEMENKVWTQDKIYLAERDKSEVEIAEEDMNDCIKRKTHEVINGALAYIRVATRRIMDNVPLLVMHFLLYKLSGKIAEKANPISLGKTEDIKSLFEEEDDIAETRESIKAELQRWTAAEKELDTL